MLMRTKQGRATMLMRTKRGVAIKLTASGDYAMIHIDNRGNAEHYEGNEELSNVAIMIWEDEFKPEFTARREWVIADGLSWDTDRTFSFIDFRYNRFISTVRSSYSK